MKLTILALALFMLVPVLTIAQTPAPAGKHEFTFAASFVKPKGNSEAYAASGALEFPIAGGYFVAGPQVTYTNAEASRSVGVVGELNLTGQDSGPFVGASYDYFVKDSPGLERGSGSARAGFKFGGLGGAFKIYAERVLTGRGKDDADYSGVAALLLRF